MGRFLIALFLGFGVIGAPTLIGQDCPPPSWYESEDSLKKPGYHVAIGSGVSLEDAKNEATASLAKTISTEISSQTTLKNKIIEQSGQHHSQEELVEAINIASQMTLRGIKPTKSVKVCDTFYVAVSISQPEAEKQLSRQDKFMENIKLAFEGKLKALDQNLSSVKTNVQKLETKSSEIEKNTQSLVEKSDIIQSRVAALQERLNAIEKLTNDGGERQNEATIVRDLNIECGNGNAESCSTLGFCFETGRIVRKSQSKAIQFYSKACENNSGRDCNYLGDLYYEGKGVPRSFGKAADFYSRGCELNDGLSCGNLGIAFEMGRGTNKSEAKATASFQKACNLSPGYVCVHLGSRYSDGTGVKKSYIKAAELYLKACDLNIGDACDKLADHYSAGFGVKQSFSEAAKLYAKACNLGVKESCRTSHIQESFEACEQNDGDGCAALGDSFWVANRVPQSTSKAAELFSKACELKSWSGCKSAGDIYSWGRGVEKSVSKASTFYRKACALGHKQSCAARDLASSPQNQRP